MNETTKTPREELRERLNSLTMDNLDFNASDYLNDGDLADGSIDDIMETLQDAVNQESEVIYYSRAIEYLSENDASLNRSLALAEEYGYSLGDLNSEKLASLLKYDEDITTLWSIKDEIEEILDEYQSLDD